MESDSHLSPSPLCGVWHKAGAERAKGSREPDCTFRSTILQGDYSSHLAPQCFIFMLREEEERNEHLFHDFGVPGRVPKAYLSALLTTVEEKLFLRLT